MPFNLESSHIEVFVAAYEEGSMAKAADKLKVSPAYVTKIVKEIEEFVGTDLFLRETSGVRPTDDGRKVYSESAPLVESFRRLRMQLQALHADIRGDVNIGVLPAIPGTLLAQAIDMAIQLCADQHPQIKIKITDARGTGLIDMLQQKAIDFAFVQIPPTIPTIQSQTLFTEHLMLIADKKLLKGVEKIKSVGALSKYPLIFQTSRGSMRMLIENACANEGYSFTPAFEIDSIALQLQLCSTGQGACILPASACIGNNFLDRLAFVPIMIPGVSRSLYIVQNASYLSPQAKVTSDLLIQQIQERVTYLASTKLIRLTSQ